MDISEKQIYRFDNVVVDVSRGCLVLDGDERHLRQKAFQVLVHLLECRERLVFKNELMETVWKDTAVTDDVLVQCIKEIRRAVGDDSHNSRYIKTVPKAGYRFVGHIEENSNGQYLEEITRFELEIEEDSEPPALSIEHSANISRAALPANPKQSKILIFAACFAVVAAVSAAVFFLFLRSDEPQTAEVILPNTPGKKAIAVMFFENQSGTAELEWLREGLADMLIVNLSRSDKLSVLSRGQLNLLLERDGYYADNKIQLNEAIDIAGKSRAEAIVTGSFAKFGEKIRVDVSLLDSQSGQIQASESLVVERAAQILTEIDLLSLRLLAILDAKDDSENIAHIGDVMTDNLEAYRYYSLAVEKMRGLHSKDAIALLEKAVALDPQFAMAHARIGYVYAVTWGHADKGKPYLEKAFQLSDRLTEKDRLSIAAWYAIANLDYPQAIQIYREIIDKYRNETEAYSRLAQLLTGEELYDEAVEVLRKGLAVDSRAKNIYNTLGGILSRLGRHDEAIAAHRRYVELAPAEPNAYDSLGISLQWSGNYAEAVENYNRALTLKPDFDIATVHLANAKFQIGDYREATRLYKSYIEIATSDLERARGFESLSQIYLQKRDLASAEKAAAQSMSRMKEYFWQSVLVAIEKGDLQKAHNLISHRSEPNNLTHRGARGAKPRMESYVSGQIALKNKRTEEAIAHFQEILRRQPPTYNHSTYEDALANAWLKLGRCDEAIAEYQRILTLNPNYPLAHFSLARSFECKGNYEAAGINYRLFLETWSTANEDIPEIIEAKRFLESGV